LSFYLDASAIVPTFIKEPASERLDTFFLNPSETLIVSDFAAMEVASAVSRLVRMKRLSQAHAGRLLVEFDAWRTTASESTDFQPSDFRLADIFVRRFDLGLRAPDALHAAVCRRVDYTLVTLDRRLAGAAEALGLRVVRLG